MNRVSPWLFLSGMTEPPSPVGSGRAARIGKDGRTPEPDGRQAQLVDL